MRIRDCLVVMVLMVSCPWAVAGTASDGGGADVSVALFTTVDVRGLVMRPARATAWTARCASCAHVALTSARRLAGPADVFAGGPLEVLDVASGEERKAVGLWHFRARKAGGAFDVVLTLPSERYVEDVLSAEASPDEPKTSLEALAVLARTYALNGRHFTARPGHLAAQLCDSTECQAMRFGPVTASVADAVRSTAGETLWFRGRRAEVFFSQNCGGITEDAGAVWPELAGVPYLRSHVDPYCVRRDTARWHAEVSLTTLQAVARAEGWKLPRQILGIEVVKRSASHRVLQVAFTGANGERSVVAASALRFGIGRALGWNRVRSDAYEVVVRNGSLVFDGRGHGHGVGLCQAGAREMGVEGKSAGTILSFYFPGTAMRILPSDNGWTEMRVGALRVRSTAAPSDAREDLLREVWADAQRRFPVQQSLTPEITFAPSTELFRQLTSEPGWELASTSGEEIVLQPEALLRERGPGVERTLLHEMLHALVESQASPRAPLWLREGLVEVLAGDAGHVPAGMPAAEIEQALREPRSQQEDEKAHRAAAAQVRELVGRYGISAVRTWLSSGVPAGVV